MDVPDIGPALKVGPMLEVVLIPCFRRSFERDVIAVAEGHRSEVHVQGTRGSEAMGRWGNCGMPLATVGQPLADLLKLIHRLARDAGRHPLQLPAPLSSIILTRPLK